jgi:hypothetical protein
MPAIGNIPHEGRDLLRELVVLVLAVVAFGLLALAYYAGDAYQNHQDQHLYAPYHAPAVSSTSRGPAGDGGSAQPRFTPSR